MESLLKPTLQLLAILAAAMVSGSVFGIWRGYDPAGYSPAAFVEVHQGAVRGLNVLLPAIGLATILLTVILTVQAGRQSRAFPLYLLAVLGFLAGGIVTRFGNQPINAVIMQWTPASMPADWQAMRDSWWTWHKLRLAASVGGLLFLVAAVLADRPGAS